MKVILVLLCLTLIGCSDGIDLNELSVPCGDNLPEFVTPDCPCDSTTLKCPPKKRCIFIDGNMVVVGDVFERPTTMGYDVVK